MKTAIVTGASRGIGLACATLLLEQGYHVVAGYYKNSEAALQLAGTYQNCHALCANLANATQAKQFVAQAIGLLGRVDLLVNNAGAAHYGLINDMTVEEWDALFALNLRAMFLCSQGVLPAMLQQQKGAIINISSMWGQIGASCEVAYSATKGGVIAFTKALAKELSPSHITVNCVAPGAVDTDMTRILSEDTIASLTAEIPIGRLTTAREVAEAVYYLANARSVTGQVLGINGGMVM